MATADRVTARCSHFSVRETYLYHEQRQYAWSFQRLESPALGLLTPDVESVCVCIEGDRSNSVGDGFGPIL